MLELIKYYLVIKVSLNAVRNIYKIRNLSIPYFDERYMYEAKNYDLDLSVEWFQLLFRKIKLT